MLEEQAGDPAFQERLYNEFPSEIEAITDPGVGMNRLAWYDTNNGEIGDICAGVSTPASVTGGDGVKYVVQREWSNRAHACIVTR